MSLNDEARLLCDYGLTTNQAIIYIAAVRLGAALVSRISRVSGVRREDVYRTMAHLEEMGLIEKMSTKPTKIRAVPVEQAISLLIERQKEAANRKIAELTARKDIVLSSIRSQTAKVSAEEESVTEFALLSSKEEVLGKLIGMLESADNEIATITSASELVAYLSLLREPLRRMAQRGAKLCAILDSAPAQRSITRGIRGRAFPTGFVNLRYSHKPLGHYVIADFEQVIMATSPEAPLGERPYLWTCDEKFAEAMCKNFEETWHACEAASLPKRQSRKE